MQINIIQPEGEAPYVGREINGEWMPVVEMANTATHIQANDARAAAAKALDQFDEADDAQQLDGWKLVSGPDHIEGVGDRYVYEAE